MTEPRVFLIEGITPDGIFYTVGYCGVPELMLRLARGRGLNEGPGRVTPLSPGEVPEDAVVWREEEDLPPDTLAFVQAHDDNLMPRDTSVAPDEYDAQIFNEMEGSPLDCSFYFRPEPH